VIAQYPLQKPLPQSRAWILNIELKLEFEVKAQYPLQKPLPQSRAWILNIELKLEFEVKAQYPLQKPLPKSRAWRQVRSRVKARVRGESSIPLAKTPSTK
jgi:hypothetical protein